MYNGKSDIGYCISQVLKDYSVTIDPELCLLLSNPLWLGLNVAKTNAYSPIESNVVSYLNPLFLENFSVNTNCLFLPVRGNSKSHFPYLAKRLQNNKKTLVKVSEKITDGNGKPGNNDTAPTLALVENISTNTELDCTTINLKFSEQDSMQISEQDFVEHWYSNSLNGINTEWFALIPSQNKPSEELLKQKLASAFVRQCQNLKPGHGSMLSGSAVIEFLKDSLIKEKSQYRLPEEHYYLWHKKTGITDLRRKYANALDKINTDEAPGFAPLKSSLIKSAEAWEHFFCDLNECTTAQTFAAHYKTLIGFENGLVKHFEKIL